MRNAFLVHRDCKRLRYEHFCKEDTETMAFMHAEERTEFDRNFDVFVSGSNIYNQNEYIGNILGDKDREKLRFERYFKEDRESVQFLHAKENMELGRAG
ncbi:hypothetical protein SUGI_1068530 [Cryptomeria japonica]|nr:hypothetical protein SUGI_1068530 [Cryptomeria japonica]